MNKKLLIEFILVTIFFVSGVCGFFKVLPYASLITALSGFFLGALYFYGSFWLYSGTGISLINRIVGGLLYSITIVACAFCFLNWPFWKLYGIISYIALGIMLMICLFNYKNPAYKPQLYRCIFFLIALSVIYGYKRLWI